MSTEQRENRAAILGQSAVPAGSDVSEQRLRRELISALPLPAYISEAVIRTGAVADLFPSTFPSGQGSDLAGVVEEAGAGAGAGAGGELSRAPYLHHRLH